MLEIFYLSEGPCRIVTDRRQIRLPVLSHRKFHQIIENILEEKVGNQAEKGEPSFSILLTKRQTETESHWTCSSTQGEDTTYYMANCQINKKRFLYLPH